MQNNHCLAGKNTFKNYRGAHFFSPMSIMAKMEQQLKRWDEPTNQPMKKIKSIQSEACEGSIMNAVHLSTRLRNHT